MNAMSLSGVHRTKADAAMDINLRGNRLKMVWAHAPSIPAEVIELFTLRDWPDEPFVVPPVPQYGSLIAGLELGVPST